ncbi:MAG: S8 family serine peptidase [Bdellovibrio sp.]|nr:S8 family serine peptidase [Bdellovibrio sp.]
MKNLLLLLILSLLAMAYAQAKQSPPHASNRLIVKLHEGATIPNAIGVKSWRNLFGQVYLVFTTNLEETAQELKNDGNVIYVERDYYGRRDKMDLKLSDIKGPGVVSSEKGQPFNDPYLSKQWALTNSESYGMSVIRAYQNRQSAPKEEIIVAVVDTGVDVNHQDLPIWKNLDEIPSNGIDDDQNGYIDDIYGINTLVRDSQGRATMDNRDGHSHGTHVSGSIGALQNNSVGVVGVASKVKIMGIRTVPNNGDELDTDVVEAFIYAAKNGARVINCSFGKAHNEGGMAVSEAIEYIGKNYNTLVVAAAGNDSSNIDRTPTYPASYTNDTLLVVAATTSSGGLAYFSNYGAVGVDVAAPGNNIYSSLPGNRYGNMSGTSMASPNTAGVAAEVLSYFPELSANELREVLIRSVAKVGSFSGRMVSGGRVDLQRALEEAGRALGQ